MKLEALAQVGALDDVAVTRTILMRNGQPYTAADGTPMTVKVLGSESKAVQAAKMETQRALLKNRKKDFTPELLLQNRITVASAAIAEWYGVEEADGSPSALTAKNKDTFLRVPHILEQVEEGVDEHVDFSGPSSMT